MTKEFLETVAWCDFGKKANKLYGRHNYTVEICRWDKTAMVGHQKAVKNASLYNRPLISTVKELGLLWASFTYKKDLTKFIEELKQYGYQIYWV